MSDEHVLFIIYNIFLLCFYLMRRNGFDLFGISFFSSFIYFSPGLFGYAGVLVTLTEWVYLPIAVKTYYVYFIFLTTLFLGTIAYDFVVRFNSEFDFDIIRKKNLFTSEVTVSILLLLVAFILVNAFGGGALHNLDKNEVMANVGRWYVLFETMLLLSFAYVLTVAKFKKYFLVLAVFIAFDIYLGFRTTFVIIMLMAFFVFFNRTNKRLISLWPYLSLGVFVVFFVLMLKLLMFGLKKGDIDILVNVLSNSSTYEKLLSTSEPFVTQAILNSVVIYDFKTDGEHLKLILLQFVVAGDVVFDGLRSFNDYFQPALFPKITYGMASNFLAEFYSVSGFFGVFFVSVFYVLILLILNFSLLISPARFKPLLLLGGVFWGFYIYRNDVAFLLYIEKRVIIGFLLITVASMIWKFLRRPQVLE
jgi:hypothetical protein